MTTINLTPEQERFLMRYKGSADKDVSPPTLRLICELADQLPDPIRVGDRVRHLNGGQEGAVIALYSDVAWVDFVGYTSPVTVSSAALERVK